MDVSAYINSPIHPSFARMVVVIVESNNKITVKRLFLSNAHLSLVASWVLLIPAYVDWHGCVDISYSGLTAVSGIQE